MTDKDIFKNDTISINKDRLMIDLWFYEDEILKNRKLHSYKDKFFYQNIVKFNKTDDISYRMINHWSSIWLINDIRKDKNKWRKYNIVDTIWVSIVSYLRVIWMKVKTIMIAKKDFYKNKKNIELYIIKAIIWEHIRCYVTSDWRLYFVDEIEIHDINNSTADNYIVISLSKIISRILWKSIIEDNITSIPLYKKDFWFYRTLVTANDWDSIQIKVKENKIHKYKSLKNPTSKNIQNIKQITLNDLKKYKNSKIVIDTNNEWITSIVVENKN